MLYVACIFKLCYHTPFQDSVLSGTEVAPTSQVHMPTVVLLQIVEK
jgi:hypothetical protein